MYKFEKTQFLIYPTDSVNWIMLLTFTRTHARGSRKFPYNNIKKSNKLEMALKNSNKYRIYKKNYWKEMWKI